ncbi:flagellar filament capping protein FliD [Nocardioides sp. W3-2-3]|uniref:flagellar filament capping protein FliD n=1 Tax=Nocardioides convexus TaxID=2712224 RepID=UPI002418A75F|nr:flagellar filament capping protein FliD [Nocardioides convexus]NHA00566.1 flagellar filament capping protein FliD [Nocardioides convexus]
MSATSAAAPGGFTVTVGQTALSHQVVFTEAHAKSDSVTGTTTGVLLKRDGQPDVAISTANGTLEELATAINGANAGVRATLVRTGTSGGTDQYRLLVESTATGEAQAFESTDSTSAPLLGGGSVRAGRDASIEIGGITATSTSNTFANVVPGVTVTLGTNATGSADLTLSRDAQGRSDAVKSFVDQVNAALTSIAALTTNTTDAKGTLAGDSTLRRVASALQDAIYPGDGTSMAKFGVQIDRYGKVSPSTPTRLCRGVRRGPGRRRSGVHRHHRLRGAGAEGRQRRQRQVLRLRHQRHHQPHHHDHPPEREHRGLGRPAGACAGRPSSGSTPRSRPRSRRLNSQSSWLTSQPRLPVRIHPVRT